MSTMSAAAISGAVRASRAPTDPCVSTRTSWPSAWAAAWMPSAAMKVWAMPVGHEVIAAIFLGPAAAPAAGEGASAPVLRRSNTALTSLSTSSIAARARCSAPNRPSPRSPSPTSSTARASAMAASGIGLALAPLPRTSRVIGVLRRPAALRRASAARTAWVERSPPPTTARSCAMGFLLGFCSSCPRPAFLTRTRGRVVPVAPRRSLRRRSRRRSPPPPPVPEGSPPCG